MSTISTTMFKAVHLHSLIKKEEEEAAPDTERDPNPPRKETLQGFPPPVHGTINCRCDTPFTCPAYHGG